MSNLKDEAEREAEMDMTPMIDCVFLLMIFFVLVIDLSQRDLEDLILPVAKYAVPDENPPDVRPIVNIAQDGRMVYKQNTWYDPARDGDNTEGIRRLLIEWKGTVVKDKDVENLGGRQVTVVNDPVLIRADKWTEWHYVGVFMTACSQPEAAFWKLELALSEDDKERKLYPN
ncbi:MAG: biopolymer transporter ExbD [Planctomycetes bacterium]|nr:biopolymer transporter ExbD [Planctomycetota bacterium]